MPTDPGRAPRHSAKNDAGIPVKPRARVETWSGDNTDSTGPVSQRSTRASVRYGVMTHEADG